MRLDRRRPPLPERPGTDQPLRFPDFHYRQIHDGLEIYAARWGRSPLVSLELLAPGGGQYTPAETPGLASFTASLLDEGTSRLSGAEISRRIERLGGGLSSGADWDCTSVTAACLSKDLETGLDLASAVLTDPTFPTEAIHRERARRQAETRRRRSRPGYLADRALLSTLYRGTVYQHPLIGTSEGLETSSEERIRGFFQRVVSGPIRLIAVGDLEPEAIAAMAARRLSESPTSASPNPPEVEPPAPEPGLRIRIVHRPGGSQTELRLGHVGVPRAYSRRPALVVMTSLLGGKFTSRINLNLRERHGYTYGARASFSTRRGPGPFIVSTAVETPAAAAATREVLLELRRVRDALVTEVELEETIGYLLGVFPYTLQQASGVASRLAQIAIYDLPHDHYQTLPDRLGSVSREAIREVAVETLHPDRLTAVVVGPAEELEPQFADFDHVEVVEASTVV